MKYVGSLVRGDGEQNIYTFHLVKATKSPFHIWNQNPYGIPVKTVYRSLSRKREKNIN